MAEQDKGAGKSDQPGRQPETDRPDHEAEGAEDELSIDELESAAGGVSGYPSPDPNAGC